MEAPEESVGTNLSLEAETLVPVPAETGAAAVEVAQDVDDSEFWSILQRDHEGVIVNPEAEPTGEVNDGALDAEIARILSNDSEESSPVPEALPPAREEVSNSDKEFETDLRAQLIFAIQGIDPTFIAPEITIPPSAVAPEVPAAEAAPTQTAAPKVARRKRKDRASPHTENAIKRTRVVEPVTEPAVVEPAIPEQIAPAGPIPARAKGRGTIMNPDKPTYNVYRCMHEGYVQAPISVL